MNAILDKRFLRIFFGLAACSWMPHWACHYYRLETQSTFVVGSWSFSFTDSAVSLLIYSVLVAINLLSISAERFRPIAATLTGIGHLALGSIHAYRLWRPFTFEVFGYSWTSGASLREALIVIPFGLLSLFVAITVRPKTFHGVRGISFWTASACVLVAVVACLLAIWQFTGADALWPGTVATCAVIGGGTIAFYGINVLFRRPPEWQARQVSK